MCSFHLISNLSLVSHCLFFSSSHFFLFTDCLPVQLSYEQNIHSFHMFITNFQTVFLYMGTKLSGSIHFFFFFLNLVTLCLLMFIYAYDLYESCTNSKLYIRVRTSMIKVICLNILLGVHFIFYIE